MGRRIAKQTLLILLPCSTIFTPNREQAHFGTKEGIRVLEELTRTSEREESQTSKE